MGLVRATVAVASLAFLGACATSAPPPVQSAPPPTPAPQAVQAAPAAEPPAADTPGTTALTGATLSTTEPTPQGWSDDQIVGVLVAAYDGDAQEASAALELSHSARISRFAQHMQSDDRVLGERVRAIATRLGTRDSAARLEVDVERAGYVVRMREVPEEKVDSIFLRAQKDQCEGMIQLIDRELLGAARDPELIGLLREIRAGAAQHLDTAKEIEAFPGRRH
jgi:hypothetical protein